MSLGARATKGAAKGKERAAHDKPKDKPQPKEKLKPQATTEQLRMANMIDRKADDTADVRKMVKMVQDLMEMTCRTEEEVCSALHDSDNDVVAACNLLLETEHTHTGEWQTREKKKKKPAAANNGDAEPPREPRERSGPRPRRGEGERGERGEGSGRGRGGGRGGRGAGRGGRGGARGGRGAPRGRPDSNRDWPHHPPQHSNPMGDTFPATEDWDNEEWSGSLSDTKVFTPSVNPQPAMDGDAAQTLPAATEDWETPEPAAGEGHIPTYTYHNPAAHHVNIEQLGGRVSPAAGGAAAEQRLAPDAFLHQHQHQPHPVQPMGMSGSLSAAQSHYLSQLTQQTQRHDNSVYSTNYGVYGSSDITSQRKPQRARVPPPSKIPSSAVEMPGGAEGGGFLDVQFGALDDLPDTNKPQPPTIHMPVGSPAPAAAPEPAPAPAPLEPPHSDPAPVTYSNANAMLSESLSSGEPAAASQPAAAPDPALTNSASSLEKQLTASMKQLSVSAADPAPMHLHMPQHRPKPPTVSASSSSTASASASANTNTSASAANSSAPANNTAQNMYSVHPVSHHPQPYSNVYAPPVNSSNASLSAGAALPQPYPSSVTLTQYQPIMNSYQTSSSAGVYNSSALYTAAPYTAYQPAAHPAHAAHAAQPALNKHATKEQPPQQAYESSAAVSSSLASTSTTQTSTAKVATTTGHVPVTGNSSSAAGYAGSALYGSQGYAAYDDQLMRSTMPHHMGGYYEVGYGVGVGGGARDATFGLGAGERFARSDAASPQQVPTAALPPGYAYYYQPPPPTTYQYGVYPNVSELRVQFGAGSGVGGAGGGKVPAYTQQQPQYDAQDSYKPGGGYGASGSKSGGATSADLTNAMYAKTHVTLNKVNSYEKAGFHSGTPPPFGAASHLYIAAPHHHPHAPQQHQMDARMNSSQNRRAESGSGGARGGSKQAPHNKPAYTHSFWPTN